MPILIAFDCYGCGRSDGFYDPPPNFFPEGWGREFVAQDETQLFCPACRKKKTAALSAPGCNTCPYWRPPVPNAVAGVCHGTPPPFHETAREDFCPNHPGAAAYAASQTQYNKE